MMVTFVSQCEKKALNRTRRVLDAFANRIGDNTWQTVITEEGLQAVKKLLRKTASKNTAVACHWIRSRSRSELFWVVGRRSAFDDQGRVPVNLTESEVHSEESTWLHVDAISILAGLAGLFHDVGKANVLFQQKLDKHCIARKFEPYRHEWVSLKIFQAFVGSDDDKVWIERLSTISSNTELAIQEKLSSSPKLRHTANWADMPPVAKLVSWLIVSHHRLPVSSKDNKASIECVTQWFSHVDASWNADRRDKEFEQQTLRDNWRFEYGTPLSSVCWQIRARKLAERAKNCPMLYGKNWLECRFSAHLSRCSLMLADHFYSALPPRKSEKEWQDPNYRCYANTDKQKKKKQKLDEHNVAVASYASRIARSLPSLRRKLPEINSRKTHRALTKTVAPGHKESFGWQDQAVKISSSLTELSHKHGFFGINMASTGSGKTVANAKIMYALSGNKQCRFTVALGLRTLTLRTGDALKELLKLSADEIAVLIGSHAVKQLHNLRLGESVEKESPYQSGGSESATPLLQDNVELEYKNEVDLRAFPPWLTEERGRKLLKLLHAPVLISTIDYLIPATEGVRGGRQIAPMLRLLTSDLVLDEPDDFNLEDMPALCRLVNWAGMLGSRVLLSTATLPPALAYALFDAYRDGRAHFSQATAGINAREVCCAWFDEVAKPISVNIDDIGDFKKTHQNFVNERVRALLKKKPTVKGKLLNLSPAGHLKGFPAISCMAETIHQSSLALHQRHATSHTSGKRVSIGLVRLANINPLAAVAKKLFQMDAPKNHHLHLCIYHSQYPVIVRSYIESKLDKALSRKNETAWWGDSSIEAHIADMPEKHHIFIVLATPVAEVGRDHDYDWAIAEPSSMRSLIQLAGRVQRHRKQIPETENFYILSTNFRGLKGRSPAYCRPGFETSKQAFFSHDLNNLMKPEEYDNISAMPRIKQPEKPGLILDQGRKSFCSFNGLEHMVQHLKLFGNQNEPEHAKLWWQHPISWSAELQAMQPFRKSQSNEFFCLTFSERKDTLVWQEKDMSGWPPEINNTNKIRMDHGQLSIGAGISPWFDIDIKERLQELVKRIDMSDQMLWQTFTEVQLRKPGKDRTIEWQYNEYLGIYEKIED